MNEKQENIVKATAKRLGMTYRQLGEAVGYGEEAISKAARTDNISSSMQKALELYNENLELKSKLSLLDDLSTILQKILPKP